MSDQTYAGDVNPDAAWQMLSEDPNAVLLDVRTDAEWAYVGLPDVGSLGKQTVCVEWQTFPAMDVNPSFAEDVMAQGVSKDSTLLIICRSGQRSRHAAIALTSVGYRTCYNVGEGFEGDCDAAKHRGSVSGWKVRGLPWRQS